MPLTNLRKAKRIAKEVRDYFESRSKAVNLSVFDSAFPLENLIQEILDTIEDEERTERRAILEKGGSQSQTSSYWPQQEPGIDY